MQRGELNAQEHDPFGPSFRKAEDEDVFPDCVSESLGWFSTAFIESLRFLTNGISPSLATSVMFVLSFCDCSLTCVIFVGVVPLGRLFFWSVSVREESS